MTNLINEGQKEKAKKIIDLALTKMPLEYYGFYSLIDPFAEGYYKLGNTTEARKLLKQLAVKYQEELRYYSELPPSEQRSFFASDIYTDLVRYKSLLEIMKTYKDKDFHQQEKEAFNNINKRFSFFDVEME